MSTQTVHFTLGERFGILLTQIAQEHIMYNYDVKKGLDTIVEGLPGIPIEMALAVIKGDYVIEVNESGEDVSINTERNETHKDYPIFNVGEWCVNKYKELSREGSNIKGILEIVSTKFRYRTKIFIDIPVSSMRSLFAGTLDGNEALQYLLEDEYVSRAYDAAIIAKNFMDTALKIHNTIIALTNLYISTFTENEQSSLLIYREEALSKMNDITGLMQRMMEGDFEDEKEDNSVTKYLNAMPEINEVLSNGIEPVDIMDKYDAGWLSPEGEFYALNGEIANMLHNQIADALQEKGIIPEDAASPDAWLEQQGWVKIHDNNVQFAGCLNSRIGLKNVQMTDKQIEIIRDYIMNCHQSEIKLGWRLTILSAGMFWSIAQDRIAMNKKYFDF